MSEDTLDIVPLVAVPNELATITGGPAPTYFRVWNALTNHAVGDVRPVRLGDRLFIWRRDLPRIAEHFEPRSAAK
jgi:hypothetical protein